MAKNYNDQNDENDRNLWCMTKLSREDSVRGVECVKGLQCYSPARVAANRLLAIVRKCRGRKKVNVPVVFRDFSSIDRRRNDIDGVGGGVSGQQRQEMSFSMAAGIGLLSLIAASKTELDRTVELRKQMEVFLRSAKQGNNDTKNLTSATTAKQTETECSAYAVSTTIDKLSNLSTYSQEVSGISYETETCVDGVHRIEQELAAELDRLQMDIESADVSEIHEEITEISSNDISSGEIINPNNDGVITEHYGVPPLELERRLHELLEARQEERIKELEAHLELMKEKLQEKEVEVIWWKDTAKLISKQVPESSRAKVVCED